LNQLLTSGAETEFTLLSAEENPVWKPFLSRTAWYYTFFPSKFISRVTWQSFAYTRCCATGETLICRQTASTVCCDWV